ncbi:class II aldolase/adducin family protein [Limnohabitans sp. Rim8]|uniref:class II aldolase/adducin family protein n=1 Tax=Limnohabitans sp. Rim8 TaxID=1100718 RepID=UPI00261BDC55|nr:class II aldolase/adducin family protein [Limnohabitans sp. Rim8]
MADLKSPELHGFGLGRLNFDPYRVVLSHLLNCVDPFMSVHPLPTVGAQDAAVQEVKIHLAAALRMAVLDGFEEGIDNHFTACVPGHPNQYFVLPFGLHWSEAKASDMMIFNEQGQTLEGQGVVELSAQSIHAPLHRLTGAKVVLHTHQPWATALNMLQDNRLLPATQTAAFFHGRIAYDDTYTGLASSLEEGERLAALMGDKTVLFMKNHGVVTIGDTVAQAYRRLYKLEKACQTQVLAMSTGKALNILSDDVIQRVLHPSGNDRHPRGDRERLYFEANMRILDRINPGYAD